MVEVTHIDHMEPPINRYNGMNPDFVRAVWAKRRAAMTEDQIKAMEEKARLDKKLEWQMQAQLREAAKEAVRHACNPAFDFYTETPERPSAKRIIEEVAEAHGLTPSALKGRLRYREVVRARQEAMAKIYLARPDMSLPQIGRLLGGRDHTTVLHALQKLNVHMPNRQKQAA